MAELHEREREGVTVLDMVGQWLGNTPALREAITASIHQNRRGVVLNLEKVAYVNSAWLGAIVQSFASLRQAGIPLRLLNVPPPIMQLLVITGLSTLFDVFTAEEDAVNSFFPSRPLRYPRMMRDETRSPTLRDGGQSTLRVFLCHASGDKPAVRDLYRRLASAGVKPWLDDVDLLPGQVWEREIPAAVRKSDAVLVCLSPTSVGKTGYLQREIKYALDAAEEQSDDSIFLIPGRLEPCDVPERLRRWQWVDLFMADGFDRLLTALQARALALGRSGINLEQVRSGT
jgi:anti-anti-sigma factor